MLLWDESFSKNATTGTKRVNEGGRNKANRGRSDRIPAGAKVECRGENGDSGACFEVADGRIANRGGEFGVDTKSLE